MAEEKKATVGKYQKFASLYMTGMSEQWIASIPLLLFASAPLCVFVVRLYSEALFMPYNVLDPLRTIFLIFAGITALIGIYLAVLKKQSVKDIIRGNITFIFFAAFLLWMLVSYLVVGVPDYENPQNYLGIYENEGHLMYISFIVVFFFCASRITAPHIKKAVMRYSAAASFILAALSLMDYYFLPMKSFRIIWEGCLPGVFNNPNHYGYYIALMTLLSAGLYVYEKSLKWRIFWLISSVAHCALIVVNDTFGGYLAIWAGFIFVIITGLIVYKKFPVRILIPMASLLLFTFVLVSWRGNMTENFVTLGSDVSNIAANNEQAKYAGSLRWVLWTTTAEGIMQSPLFGQGVEGWADILLSKGDVIHAHNEYLQYALFFGIPGLIFYVGGLFAVFFRGLRNRKKLDPFTLTALAAAFAYCVSAFVGNPKYYTAPFMFIMLGLGYNYCTEDAPAETKNDAGDQSSAANS